MSAAKRKAKRSIYEQASVPDTSGVSIKEIKRRLAFLTSSPRLMKKPRNKVKIHAYRMELFGCLEAQGRER